MKLLSQFLFGCVVLLSAPALAADTDAASIEFFETKIRPVLVEHCFECHSAKAQPAEGNLRLDSRDALRKGGKTGPSIVLGKPDASLLIKSLRYTDENLQMPPDGKLPDGVIADFEKWIASGAADPRTDAAAGSSGNNISTRAASHWAFQSVRRSPIPVVKDAAWSTEPIDAFVLAKLEQHGLKPSPHADRRTLAKRLYVDLTGVLPTIAEVEEFLQDTRPDAYERLVDRLLSSPRYGERWARHWLDVARFADTKDGVLMYGDDRLRPFAYTYRDYVIKAFNDDTPFNQMIEEQLAADLIEPKVEPWRLAAMGFLTLGRQFDNNIHDVIDDRIDTVTRGWLGLTVACARCHNHKYDPIPTEDYYSLYGVFASSESPLELPLIDAAESNPAAAESEQKLAAKRAELRKFLDDQYAMLLETARQRVGDYLVHAATTQPDPLETAIFFLSLAPTDLRPPMVARWRRFLQQRSQPDDPVFGPWHDAFKVSEGELANRWADLSKDWSAKAAGLDRGQINPLVRSSLQAAQPKTHADVARLYGDLLKTVYEDSKKSPPTSVTASSGATAETLLASRAREQLLNIVTNADSPAYFPKSRTRDHMSRGEKDSFGGKMNEIDRMAVQAPQHVPRAMVLNDSEQLYDPRVFVRGNPAAPAQRVPRQFLKVGSPAERQPFANGSGRLQLARAITSSENPLASRVIVNRVWMHLFGEPLAPNPSDFGLRSEAPTHAGLLDWLSADLIENGWSLKRLQRQIVLSQTYQQVSFDRPDGRRIDPDNRLLWRTNRRRLDLEAMRDSLLSVSGRFNPQMFGRPRDLAADPQHSRRTVYGLVDRQSLPGLFRSFDFASPDSTAERRPQTTVPQQALFGLNSPFVVEQVKSLVAQPEIAGVGQRPDRIKAVYQRILLRQPTADELAAADEFVQAAEQSRASGTPSPLEPWQQLAQVLLLTNEFMFVD